MLRVYDGERLTMLGLSSAFKSKWIRHSFPFRDFLIFPYCLITIIRRGSRSRLLFRQGDLSVLVLFVVSWPSPIQDDLCSCSEGQDWYNLQEGHRGKPSGWMRRRVCRQSFPITSQCAATAKASLTSKPPAWNMHEDACISSPPQFLSLAAYKFVLEWKWNIIIQAY